MHGRRGRGRGPKHESMCSAPFLTISEKLVAQGRPGPWKMILWRLPEIQPASAWISDKETKCNKASLSLSHSTFYAEEKPVFYYGSVHLTGQMALLRLSAKV